MKNTFWVVWCLSLILIPHVALSDTLILKSGKTIQSSSCWEDGDLIKCKLHGQSVGYPRSDVAELRVDAPAPAAKPANGFRFDIWQSGITVNDAIDIAEANDKPFHKHGLISNNKTFNPKMCRPYADTAIQFYYKDQIFGKWATLNFNFTPTSKRLYSLEVAFSGPGISKNSEFRERIEEMLSKKYGNTPRITEHIVFQTYDWTINDNATVTMRLGGNSIHVICADDTLTKKAENEKLEQVRSGFTNTDKEKF
jgi:hypothetical protein